MGNNDPLGLPIPCGVVIQDIPVRTLWRNRGKEARSDGGSGEEPCMLTALTMFRFHQCFPQAGLQGQREGLVPTNDCFRVLLDHRSRLDFVVGLTVLRQHMGERVVDGSYSGTGTKLGDCVDGAAF